MSSADDNSGELIVRGSCVDNQMFSTSLSLAGGMQESSSKIDVLSDDSESKSQALLVTNTGHICTWNISWVTQMQKV